MSVSHKRRCTGTWPGWTCPSPAWPPGTATRSTDQSVSAPLSIGAVRGDGIIRIRKIPLIKLIIVLILWKSSGLLFRMRKSWFDLELMVFIPLNKDKFSSSFPQMRFSKNLTWPEIFHLECWLAILANQPNSGNLTNQPINKCSNSDWSVAFKSFEKIDRPSDQQTDMRVHREVTVPIRDYLLRIKSMKEHVWNVARKP